MTHTVTLIPGDNTSPQIIASVARVLEATGVSFDWRVIKATSITPELLASARDSGTVFMGYWRGRRSEGELAPVVRLREEFGVYANLRPVQSLPGIRCRFHDVDIMVVRETTEDVYAHLEHESVPGVFESLKVTTRDACERIARFAYETARAYGRRKVTIVHKANIMKKSDGLFLKVATDISRAYPDIETEERIVDALCMQLTRFPNRFDVLLCGNLFGDIVADLCSGLVGGRANSPSANLGADVALFTTGHGDAVGAVANPLSSLFSAVLMLRHLDEDDAANRLMEAVVQTLRSGQVPVGSGGKATCAQFVQLVTTALN